MGDSYLGDSKMSILMSGSSAEFYIKPMLPCIGDIDMMFTRSDVLLIPYGHGIPTELPDWCRNKVRCYVFQIIDSHKPGYVYMQGMCILHKNYNGGYVLENMEN